MVMSSEFPSQDIWANPQGQSEESDILKELSVKHICSITLELRLFGHLIRMPSWMLPSGGISGIPNKEEIGGTDPELAGGDYICYLAWLGQDSPEKLEDVAAEKDNLDMANNNMSLFLWLQLIPFLSSWLSTSPMKGPKPTQKSIQKWIHIILCVSKA